MEGLDNIIGDLESESTEEVKDVIETVMTRRKRKVEDITPYAESNFSSVVAFDTTMNDMINHELKLVKKAKARHNIPRKYEYSLPRFVKMVQSDGDKRVRMLRTALEQLDHLGFRRSAHQRQFHEAFIGACLPQIYGQDLNRMLPRILRENNMEEIHCEIMVCCPRRWGKTMAVALYAAAYLWTQPDAEVLIYSISKRTSTMLMAKVYNILTILAGGSHIVRTHNQEELEIVNAHDATSVCRCYPSSPKISNIFIIVCMLCILRFLFCFVVFYGVI